MPMEGIFLQCKLLEKPEQPEQQDVPSLVNLINNLQATIIALHSTIFNLNGRLEGFEQREAIITTLKLENYFICL